MVQRINNFCKQLSTYPKLASMMLFWKMKAIKLTTRLRHFIRSLCYLCFNIFITFKVICELRNIHLRKEKRGFVLKVIIIMGIFFREEIECIQRKISISITQLHAIITWYSNISSVRGINVSETPHELNGTLRWNIRQQLRKFLYWRWLISLRKWQPFIHIIRFISEKKWVKIWWGCRGQIQVTMWGG